jgi:hypothetical protein
MNFDRPNRKHFVEPPSPCEQGWPEQGDFISTIDSVTEDEKGYPEPTVWKNLPVFGLFMQHLKYVSYRRFVG